MVSCGSQGECWSREREGEVEEKAAAHRLSRRRPPLAVVVDVPIFDWDVVRCGEEGQE